MLLIGFGAATFVSINVGVTVIPFLIIVAGVFGGAIIDTPPTNLLVGLDT